MKIKSDMVKMLRFEKNWSQEKLSEASGLSLRTVQRLENTGRASMDSVQALADILNVDPSELMATTQEKPSTNNEMSPFEAVKMGFVKFADFSGTATRFEYWWFFTFVALVTAVSTLINGQADQVVAIIAFIPFIALGNRRLHDVGKSGWWQLFFLVPFAGFITLYYLAQPSAEKMPQSGIKSLDIAS